MGYRMMGQLFLLCYLKQLSCPNFPQRSAFVFNQKAKTKKTSLAWQLLHKSKRRTEWVHGQDRGQSRNRGLSRKTKAETWVNFEIRRVWATGCEASSHVLVPCAAGSGQGGVRTPCCVPTSRSSWRSCRGMNALHHDFFILFLCQ